MPKSLKSWPKCNKSPNLVTLFACKQQQKPLQTEEEILRVRFIEIDLFVHRTCRYLYLPIKITNSTYGISASYWGNETCQKPTRWFMQGSVFGGIVQCFRWKLFDTFWCDFFFRYLKSCSRLRKLITSQFKCHSC